MPFPPELIENFRSALREECGKEMDFQTAEGVAEQLVAAFSIGLDKPRVASSKPTDPKERV